MDDTKERWQEIKDIWQQNQWLFVLAGFLAGVLVSPFITRISSDIANFLENLVPEAIGIGFTVLFIDRLYGRRERTKEKRDLQHRLVRESGSHDNATALNAVRELRLNRWLEGQGGLLAGANLKGADLTGTEMGWDQGLGIKPANLSRANLRKTKLVDAHLGGVNFVEADLQEAILVGAKLIQADLTGAHLKIANLQDANMRGAILENADLTYSNLVDANLSGANLKNAYLGNTHLMNTDLGYANLSGARLWNANLENANLKNVTFDEKTILPDHTHWKEDTDIECFTNRIHPNFWHGIEIAEHHGNLQGMDLRTMNLRGVSLNSANLQDANLELADLRGADLRGANLRGANMERVRIDEHTRLPDYNTGSPLTDMTRFTNPDHPKFYQRD